MGIEPGNKGCANDQYQQAMQRGTDDTLCVFVCFCIPGESAVRFSARDQSGRLTERQSSHIVALNIRTDVGSHILGAQFFIFGM